MARSGQLASAEPQQSAPVMRDMPKPIRRAELPASIPAAKEAPRPQPKPQPAAKPAPVKAAAAKPAPPRPASGPWRVQLGAFSAEARARTLWSQLSAKVGGLSAYQPYFTTSGGITRLQAGPFATSADAARLCGAIKAAGADCMPRKI
jgi:cell division septation protein DedD